ncbi:3-hydroxyisobutyryl-CoA hydrolase [Coemansia sp. RSA 1646]|nr:3-hydroxyisobutyryl-CoA hydrolase [Coemansia sp. RSA 1646]KAJ2088838.1 3-hydroxyisobutyryl-CoA hydrolase [Coemansia sp. RSA 986]KAJ2212333.1 3-hydroxyisobutyryl-CoA hydrolase [Coemansia sp. RSA 487]
MTDGASRASSPSPLTRLNGIQRMLSSANSLEGDKHVLTVSNLTGRSLVLNRPKALNSLTLPMVQAIARHLKEWEDSDLCNLVILRSNSERAFCAGGDVVQVSQTWKSGAQAQAMKFFQEEYRLNHIIASYSKPIVAMIGGYTMGGGVGLSVHAPFRVATESSVFAMPETKIGFFPDVGATFFLSRLDGETGTYLGMTGQQLKGRDLLYAGIATHYVPSERIPNLEERLWELGSSDHDVVNAAIEEFAAQPEESEALDYSLATIRSSIDRCFRFKSVESIIEALRQEEENPEWAQQTISTLEKMSPSSLKLTLEQLGHGKRLNIQEAFTLELRLAEKRLASHDMHEGIDALLVRKTKDPKWNPPTVAEVNMNQLFKEYFETPVAYNPVFKKRDAKFTEYPHKFGLPTEADVRDLVTGDNPQAGDYVLTREEVINFFEREYISKIGTSRKVSWVLDRKTRKKHDNDSLEWVR